MLTLKGCRSVAREVDYDTGTTLITGFSQSMAEHKDSQKSRAHCGPALCGAYSTRKAEIWKCQGQFALSWNSRAAAFSSSALRSR